MNHLRNYLLLLVGVLLSTFSYGQKIHEKILNNQNSNSCFGAVSIGSNVFFNFNSADFYKGYSKEAKVYRCDNNINISDSIDLSHYGGFDLFHISNIVSFSDSTFLVLGQGVIQNPYSETFSVLVMDTSLNIIKVFDSGLRSDTIVGGLSVCVVDSFLIFGGFQLQGISPKPIYLIFDEDGNFLEKKVVKHVPFGVVNGLYNFNGKIYGGFRPSQYASVFQIDSKTFEITRLDTGSRGFAPGGFVDFDDSPNSFYFYGEYFSEYLGFAKIDTNLTISIIDTFSSVNNPNTSSRGTVADIGILAAKSEREIYFATGEGAYYIPQQLQPGLITNMKLWRIDTGGNVIWSVLVNDSSYYFPTKTVATSDGGAVFFSMKYDWRIDPQPKTSLSIIKLDSTGNFVGLTEIEVPYQNLGIDVFPNPFTDGVTISGVEAREVRSATIYDVNGKVVIQEEQPESLEFDTSSFVPGTYFLQVVLKSGQSGVYKVVRE